MRGLFFVTESVYVSAGSAVLAALPVRRESERTNLIRVLECAFGYHVPYIKKVVESLVQSTAVNVRFHSSCL